MTADELRKLAEVAPDALLPARLFAVALEGIEEPAPVTTLNEASVETWAERLWRVPAETRLGVVEVAEALRRPRSFIYARTGGRAENPIPHRKMDGSLVFTCGELRAWLRDHEEVIHAGPYLSVASGGGS